MLNTIVRERKVFISRRQVESTAETLNQDDEDGWVYRVRTLSDGNFVIAVYDENRDFVEYWS